MNMGEFRKATADVPDYADITIFLHDLAEIDEIVSITAVEVHDSQDADDPHPIHVEVYHDYS